MNVISIASPVTDHASIRDAFAQAAYAGRLPRERWIEAQRLICDYDAAADDAGRLSIAHRMDAINDGCTVDWDSFPPLRAVG